jgi:hypothetical protein
MLAENYDAIMQAAFWPKRTMTLAEAWDWFDGVVEAGFDDFNGCSFAPDFDILKECNLHDALWALLPVHRHIADAIFRMAIIIKGGIKHWILGWGYWSAVRFAWLGGLYKFVGESYRHIKRLFTG